jgi:hypothetical protein
MDLFKGQIGRDYNFMPRRRTQNSAIISNTESQNAAALRGACANRGNEGSLPHSRSGFLFPRHAVQHTAAVTISGISHYKMYGWAGVLLTVDNGAVFP